jgi:hypothetical protein
MLKQAYCLIPLSTHLTFRWTVPLKRDWGTMEVHVLFQKWGCMEGQGLCPEVCKLYMSKYRSYWSCVGGEHTWVWALALNQTIPDESLFTFRHMAQLTWDTCLEMSDICVCVWFSWLGTSRYPFFSFWTCALSLHFLHREQYKWTSAFR